MNKGIEKNVSVPFVVSYYDFQNQVSHDLKFPTYPQRPLFWDGGGGRKPQLDYKALNILVVLYHDCV